MLWGLCEIRKYGTRGTSAHPDITTTLLSPSVSLSSSSVHQIYVWQFASVSRAPALRKICSHRVQRHPRGQRAPRGAGLRRRAQEARQQAQAEKLTLVVAENKAGYFGVHLHMPPASPSPIYRRG